MDRKHTNNELVAMVRDTNLIISVEDITEILDTCWPLDYKDTFIVPDGEDYFFRGGGILINGKNDIPKLKAYWEKEKTCKLLLRRSRLNRLLAGETDCLNEPLTPEALEELERERDLIQEDILKAVGPLLDPDGKIIPSNPETPGNEEFKEDINGIDLPPEIDTPRARKAFEKALKAGFLEKTPTGYRWQVFPKAAAAYFFEQIYSPAISDPPPIWEKIENLLGYKRLEQTAYQNKSTKNDRPWKQKIDTLFED